MKFPKAKKMTKRTIDLVHLAAASVWLSGFIALFALSLDGGASLGLTSADTQLTMKRFVGNLSGRVSRSLWLRPFCMVSQHHGVSQSTVGSSRNGYSPWLLS